MPTILLIRHGENEYVKTGRLAGRIPGVHLNEKGLSQAQAVADKLAGWPVKAIYSSPLERTMETAEPIARVLGLEIVPRQGLIETDFGEWQDRKLRGLTRLKIWRAVQNQPSLMRFPGGESFAECQMRITQELIELAAMHGPKEIIACVSHSDPIKLAIAFFIGLPLDLFQRLNVAPASINILYLQDGFSRLLALNYDLGFTLAETEDKEKKEDRAEKDGNGSREK